MTTTTTTRLPIAHATATTTTCVVGQNPECADMANPNGDIFETFWQVEAWLANGDIYVLSGFAPVRYYDNDEGTEEEREAKVQRLVERILETKTIDPDLWHFSRIAYGAEGWDEQELNNEINDARRAGERHPLDR